MKAIRIVVYEGTEKWLENVLANSLPLGRNSWGALPDGTITVIPVVDERPSLLLPDEPAVVEELRKLT